MKTQIILTILSDYKTFRIDFSGVVQIIIHVTAIKFNK